MTSQAVDAGKQTEAKMIIILTNLSTEQDDPLDDLLADLPDETETEPKIRIQKTPPEKSVLSPLLSPTIKNEEIGGSCVFGVFKEEPFSVLKHSH